MGNEHQSKEVKIYHAFRLTRRLQDDKKELRETKDKVTRKEIQHDISVRLKKLNKYSPRIRRAAKSPAAYNKYA
jgi:hypothetical protein